ncbi:MAG TPA: nucleotide sugar dehydrogenase [Rhizomicrobium sp.]|jgi:UDP-N-acetyl-D-glucosamine dehydrogenase|nr:nucleotide sugar dehydrogenase [Rhizomicrobium sp.]
MALDYSEVRSHVSAVDVAQLARRIETRNALIGVIGLGYVGQPLAIAAHAKGFRVLGFDIDPDRVAALNDGRSSIRTIPDEKIVTMRQGNRFQATNDLKELSKPDVIVICVPTPLNKYREPDMSFVQSTAEDIGRALRPGQLICLESTTYPGTTTELLKPILETGDYKVGRDVFLAFSPEREDPGNANFGTTNIPKVVGADDDASRKLAETFYRGLVDKIVPVSSSATAEAVKLTENIFRCVNIALVNELKHVYRHMGINVWEVIDAAATKPFGFMPFYPGPGLGGHCIPIDPFYLSWKAREHEVPTRFIELAGEINTTEPKQVVAALAHALSERKRKSLNGARILLLGLAYKKNVDDMRESPALAIMRLLEAQGCRIAYYDPWIPEIPETREHIEFAGRRSIPWETERFAERFDAALIVTDHDAVDYGELVSVLDLVVDTRNATRKVVNGRERIVMA